MNAKKPALRYAQSRTSRARFLPFMQAWPSRRRKLVWRRPRRRQTSPRRRTCNRSRVKTSQPSASACFEISPVDEISFTAEPTFDSIHCKPREYDWLVTAPFTQARHARDARVGRTEAHEHPSGQLLCARHWRLTVSPRRFALPAGERFVLPQRQGGPLQLLPPHRAASVPVRPRPRLPASRQRSSRGRGSSAYEQTSNPKEGRGRLELERSEFEQPVNTCIAAEHRRYAPVTWGSATALVPRSVAETHAGNAIVQR